MNLSVRAALPVFARELGLGRQSSVNVWMAVLGASGLVICVVIFNLLAKRIFLDNPLGDHPYFHYGAMRWGDPLYWMSNPVIARQRLDVLSNIAAVVSVLAMLYVVFVLIRQFNWRMSILIAGLALVIGCYYTKESALRGPVTQFIISVTPTEAEKFKVLPPQAAVKLKDEYLLVANLGFSTAFATALAAITLALKGRHDGLQTPVLRARWQAIFSIYVLAMMVIALIAAYTRGIADYAASPLDDISHGASLSEREALERLGAITAIYSGVCCALGLIAACLPSFIAIRHDIQLKAQERIQANPELSADEWMKRERLDITPLNRIAGIFATLAPIILPASADFFGAFHLL